MNAKKINLNDLVAISVVTDDGTRHQIRVAGTIFNPHFFGTDVCKILELEDHKKTLQKLVGDTHKTDLKTLIQETQKGRCLPSEVEDFKHPNLLGSFDLEKLSHNDGRAVVLSEPGLHQLLNGTRLHKHRKSIRSAVERWIWATKYETGAGLVDIFTFVRGSILAFDLDSDWFKDLWYPLSKANPPHVGGVGRVNNRPIIVTQTLLDWMGFQGRDLSDKQEKFSRVLKRNEIPYDEIGHEHPLAIEYPCVQTEMKLIPKQVEQKKWICLGVRDFKKAVMRLQTENGDSVRDYYLNLEEAMVSYGEYTAKFMIEKGELERRLKDEELSGAMNMLTIKDKEIEDKDKALEDAKNAGVKTRSMLKEAEQRAIEAEKHAAFVLEAKKRADIKAKRVNKFMNRVNMREKKLEWIYIATTKEYAKERIFKIGSTERLSSRISGYATGHPKSRAYYYGWVKQCYASKDLDYHIQKILSAFKHKEDKDDKGRGELYHGIKFTDLVDIVAFIVENYDKSIEYVNTFIKSRLDQSMEEEDEEVVPVNIKMDVNVTYQVGDSEHTETITKHSREDIREELEQIIDSIDTQVERIGNEVIVIKRSELVCRLAQVVPMDKKDLWSAIKGITKWKNGKTEIDEFGTTIKIEY